MAPWLFPGSFPNCLRQTYHCLCCWIFEVYKTSKGLLHSEICCKKVFAVYLNKLVILLRLTFIHKWVYLKIGFYAFIWFIQHNVIIKLWMSLNKGFSQTPNHLSIILPLGLIAFLSSAPKDNLFSVKLYYEDMSNNMKTLI